MSDAEILEECATYMALKNGPISGLELEQAKKYELNWKKFC